MSWIQEYDWVYQRPQPRSDDVVVGNQRAFVWPLARWLLFRWDRLQRIGDPLSQALSIAGWYPSPNDPDYRQSLAQIDQIHLEENVLGPGRRYFKNCVLAYIRGLLRLSDDTLRYIYPGRRSGEVTHMAFGAQERVDFERRVDRWVYINNDADILHRSGYAWEIPEWGLPYGPAIREQDLGSQKDRINGIARLTEWVRHNPAGEPNRAMLRSAGISVPLRPLSGTYADAAGPANWF